MLRLLTSIFKRENGLVVFFSLVPLSGVGIKIMLAIFCSFVPVTFPVSLYALASLVEF